MKDDFDLLQISFNNDYLFWSASSVIAEEVFFHCLTTGEELVVVALKLDEGKLIV